MRRGKLQSRHSCLLGYKLEPSKRNEVHRQQRESGESPRQQTQQQMALLEDARVAREVVVELGKRGEVLCGGEVRRERESYL